MISYYKLATWKKNWGEGFDIDSLVKLKSIHKTTNKITNFPRINRFSKLYPFPESI